MRSRRAGGESEDGVGGGDALLAKDRLSGLEIAISFLEGGFAVHHARVRLVAESLDQFNSDFSHNDLRVQ